MAIEYKYLAHEDEVQQVYKLSSLKENSYMLGGGNFAAYSSRKCNEKRMHHRQRWR